jgi:hypothetical protein
LGGRDFCARFFWVKLSGGGLLWVDEKSANLKIRHYGFKSRVEIKVKRTGLKTRHYNGLPWFYESNREYHF